MTTQTRRWSATLAPVGTTGRLNQIIDPNCRVTVRPGAHLTDHHGNPVGTITDVSIVDGCLVAIGELDDDAAIMGRPTFDVGQHCDSVTGPAGATVYHRFELQSISAGHTPAWDGRGIRFSTRWCVHIPQQDELIPMPDHGTAVAAANRFNEAISSYRSARPDSAPELPVPFAVVKPWPYDAASHAEAITALETDDPDGWADWKRP